MKEVAFYEKREDKLVQCHVCPHNCKIKPGEKGRCQVRVNDNGILEAHNYGQVGAFALDPIEKKPLFHFYPGSKILSLGTYGCNFSCGFCQNWQLVKKMGELVSLSPHEVVSRAKAFLDKGNIGLAYTYSEPLMWYEFVLETAELAHLEGLKNVLVTNGFINREPFLLLVPFIDALNIDLKAFSQKYYRDVCGGRIEPVLEIAKLAQKHAHVEITTLLVPGLNDSPQEIEELSQWIADNLGEDTPLHLSRYFPNYQLNLPPTPMENMRKAQEIAAQRLKNVHLGNV